MNAVTQQTSTDPLVSIIIATFNAGEFLAECLESILAQSFKNIEIIVVDGGSTDDTISILKNFDHNMITWISEPDRGIYDALNTGTKIAKGKWLQFLGADDRLLPGFSELANQLKSEHAIYYGNSEAYYYGPYRPKYILLTGKFSKYRLAKYCMNHQSILYPAGAFKKYQYDLRYKILADYDLNIKLWGDRDFAKIYYPVTVAKYNMTGLSSLTNDTLFKKDKPARILKSMGWWVYLKYRYKKYRKKLEGADDFF